MNWQRHQLWNEKLGKTIEVKQPDAAPVNIVGIPTVSPTVKMEQKETGKARAYPQNHGPVGQWRKHLIEKYKCVGPQSDAQRTR